MFDASALVSLLLDPAGYAGVVAWMKDGRGEFVVPHVCDVEVLSALRRAVRTGVAPAERALEALADYLDLPLQRAPHAHLLGRAFQLRDNFSAYDGVYVALAEGLAMPLITADARLARAARTWTDVEVVEV